MGWLLLSNYHSKAEPAKILIIEDDPILNQQLADFLSESGHSVDTCFNGNDGLLEASKQKHELVLLDIMLPQRDGLSVLNMLRKTSQVPVIILTAKGAEEERIKGLLQGADDYIPKPFNTTELLLRIEALLRRSRPLAEVTSHQLSINGLDLDFILQQAFVKEKPIELTAIQFKLLWELALNRGEVLSKAYLYQQVLKRTLGAYDRSLDMHLSRIRRKLKDNGWQEDRIHTVHGEGYCLQ